MIGRLRQTTNPSPKTPPSFQAVAKLYQYAHENSEVKPRSNFGETKSVLLKIFELSREERIDWLT